MIFFYPKLMNFMLPSFDLDERLGLLEVKWLTCSRSEVLCNSVVSFAVNARKLLASIHLTVFLFSGLQCCIADKV